MKPQHSLLIVVSAALVAVSACSSKPASSTASGAGASAAKELGTLALESKPQARVYIDDAPRGMTPLRLDLPAGPHRVRLEANSKARTLTVGVVAGAEVTQSVDLDRAVQTGSLFVRSDPAGAKVLVDNKPAGVTPITVLDLSPGSHAVSVTSADGSNARQSVQVEAGATATLRLTLDRPQVAEASTARAPPSRATAGCWSTPRSRCRCSRAAVSSARRAAACPSPRAAMTFSSVLPITPLRSASRYRPAASPASR